MVAKKSVSIKDVFKNKITTTNILIRNYNAA